MTEQIKETAPASDWFFKTFRYRFSKWSRRVRLTSKLEIGVAVLAVVSVFATFISLSRKSAPFDLTTPIIRVLLLSNVVFLLALAGLITRRLVRIWVARREHLAGSRLQSRMVGLFSAIAIVPPILMAVFSSLFLEFGVQSWFSVTVKTAVEESLAIAESYISEHRRAIESDIIAMANDLNQQAPLVGPDYQLLQRLVENQTAIRALNEAIVFTSDGSVLAQSTMNLDLGPDRVPSSLMQRVSEGELVIISAADDDRVRAIIKLDNFFDANLYVSRFVDARVLARVSAAQGAVADYQSLEDEQSSILLGFNIMFLIVALLILMAAVWLGMSLANQLIEPIARLVDASDKVGRGDLDVKLPDMKRSDELGLLSRAFSRMTRDLKRQQKELLAANEQLDGRRRFTEAVLSGVSAGVIGLDLEGKVTLPNRAARDFLDATDEDLKGKALDVVMPEVAPVFLRFKSSGEDSIEAQVTIGIGVAARTLMVRISTEESGGEVMGYVVTFDDITDQLADQRIAAWADVARRIAHEIKNPLTPIQLSAERLQRKYQSEVTSDPEIFTQCTETIIRQVGDLRRMVDEFSSFARMPAPVFKTEDVGIIVRQAVFLQEVALPAIKLELISPESEISLFCDGRLLAQALTNLIKNASEAIQAGTGEAADGDRAPAGEITIRVTLKKNSLELQIEDNGIGLPEELAERLAEPYVTTRTKGTGLGLAIVRKIMEDHGGTLKLRNRQPRGAVAVLTFNLKALNAKARIAEALGASSIETKTDEKGMEATGHGA